MINQVSHKRNSINSTSGLFSTYVLFFTHDYSPTLLDVGSEIQPFCSRSAEDSIFSCSRFFLSSMSAFRFPFLVQFCTRIQNFVKEVFMTHGAILLGVQSSSENGDGT